jgi:hypothetical protein
MVKTSFRLAEETRQALAQLGEKYHNGNATAALAEAIQRYYAATLEEVKILGWVAVREYGKARCAKCKNPLDGAPAFVTLEASGRVGGELHCAKCAR